MALLTPRRQAELALRMLSAGGSEAPAEPMAPLSADAPAPAPPAGPRRRLALSALDGLDPSRPLAFDTAVVDAAMHLVPSGHAEAAAFFATSSVDEIMTAMGSPAVAAIAERMRGATAASTRTPCVRLLEALPPELAAATLVGALPAIEAEDRAAVAATIPPAHRLPAMVQAFAAAGDDEARADLLRALPDLADPALLDHAARLLDDRDEWTRAGAATILAQLGSPAHPALWRALELPDPDVRLIAFQALAGTADARGLLRLHRGLGGGHVLLLRDQLHALDARWSTLVRAWLDAGGHADAAAAVPTARTMLADADVERRCLALRILAEAAEAARPAARAAVARLTAEEPAERTAAIRCCDALGMALVEAQDELLALLAGRHPDGARLAQRLLSGLVDPETVATWAVEGPPRRRQPALALLLRQSEGFDREEARAQGPRLLPLLDDPDPALRAAALETLAGLGGGQPAIVERLGALIAEPIDAATEHAAALALAAAGGAGAERAVALIAAADAATRCRGCRLLEGMLASRPRLGDSIEAVQAEPLLAVLLGAPATLDIARVSVPALIDRTVDQGEDDAVIAAAGRALGAAVRTGLMPRDACAKMRESYAQLAGAVALQGRLRRSAIYCAIAESFGPDAAPAAGEPAAPGR